MKEHFMISDLVATSEAIVLWVPILFIPGYVFGWLLDALGFRRRAALARCAISMPLAIAVVPIVTYLLWHLSLAAVWVMYASCFIGFVALLFHERHILSWPTLSKRAYAVLAIIAGWVVLATLLLIDLQIGNRLYFPLGVYDYTLRDAVTASITNTGIPPNNPYFFPGRAFVLHYHYFWYMLCSLVDMLGGARVTARHAMLAGIVWGGIGLMASIPVWLRFVQPRGPENIERRTLIGLMLLSVTGLDLIPTLLLFFVLHQLFPSIEWWNNQVDSWIRALLWSPHYIAALVAGLTGLAMIRCGSRASRSRQRILAGVVAGFAFASSAGLGIYMAAIFAVFLMLWLVIALLRDLRREAILICISGVVAFAAAIPYLMELRGGRSAVVAGGVFPFQFTIRSFAMAESFVEVAWPYAEWHKPFLNAVMLPLNYSLEFGFFCVVGVMQWKTMHRGKAFLRHPELFGFVLASTSLLICTFVRSTVISNNDLGWLGMLIAQFALLIWAAELWDDGLAPWPVVQHTQGARSFDSRVAVSTMLIIGVAGSVYEVCGFRIFTAIFDDLDRHMIAWLGPDHNLGRRTYALREVYDQLRNELPKHAIVQHNPNTVPGDLFYGLYADRQAAAETSGCGVVFGGDPALCAGVIGPLDDLFEKPGAVEAERVDGICRDLSIDALVVKDTDKVWADRNSWVWKKKPDLENDYARVFLCGRTLYRAIKPKTSTTR